MSSPIVGRSIIKAVLFASYTEFQYRQLTQEQKDSYNPEMPLSSYLNLSQIALAGAGAGLITSFVQSPIEMVKNTLQVQDSASALPTAAATRPRYSGAIDCVQKVGIPGLYRGIVGTLVREIPSISVYFFTYEALRNFFKPPGEYKTVKDISSMKLLIAGGLGGMCAWVR